MKNALILTFVFSSILLFSQSDKELVEETIDQHVIKSHIGFLASDALKGRDTPSPELEIAAEYLKSRFIEYGVTHVDGMDTYFQRVAMKRTSPPQEGEISIGKESFVYNNDFLLMDGEEGQVEAEMVYVGYGMDEIKQEEIEGKIVISLCGDGESFSPQAWIGTSIKKGAKFQELGALALIELYNSTQVPWSVLVKFLNKEQVLLDDQSSTPLTRIWMNRSQEDLQVLDQEELIGKIDIQIGRQEKFVTKNVVGYVEGSDPELKNEFIVYSAHYDHVGVGSADESGDTIYNGSRDNAVGTVTVLSSAENIAKYPTKRSALFVLFTGEEKGLLGSEYFVEHSPIDLKNIVYCFNSDNGGYNDTSIATIIGLTRTTAERLIRESCEAFGLQAIEDPAPEQGLFDRSDNVNFAAKGIPAPTFSLGFTAFDSEIAKYYHQPGDEPETLDYLYLEKFFKSYVLSCRKIANDTETPFWVAGDKYHTAGQELYKR